MKTYKDDSKIAWFLFILLAAQIGLGLLNTAHAAEDPWFCTEAASQRSGNIVKSCGTAINQNETSAQMLAFNHAKDEFDRVCLASEDCKGHKIEIEAKRTQCERIPNKYVNIVQCRRLVVFNILSNMD